MSESAGLTLIKTQIEAVSGFSSTNVTIAKWGVLNKGGSNHYAIIRPGRVTRTAHTFTVKDNEYQTIVEVWQRYKDDGTTVTDLITNVDLITSRIDQYRKLADSTGAIRDANIVEYSEVKEQWSKDGGVSWLSRDIIILWQEQEAVSYAE